VSSVEQSSTTTTSKAAGGRVWQAKAASASAQRPGRLNVGMTTAIAGSIAGMSGFSGISGFSGFSVGRATAASR
jgi:hypothetical protein